jgi:hypothetical protein
MRQHFVNSESQGSLPAHSVNGSYSKRARSVLRHIRVTSKQELMDRIMAAIDYTNRHPRHSHPVVQDRRCGLI